MEFLKTLKQNKERIICAYIFVLVYFGIDRTIEYATDSYAALMMDDNWKVKVYDNGRVLQGLLYYVIEQFHLSAGLKYQISYLTAFLFLGLSVYFLSSVIKKYVKGDTLSVFIAFITIVNPFFVDFFLFIEKGMFCFVIFLNVFAFSLTAELFTNEDSRQKTYTAKKKAILSVIVLVSLLISVLMYQTLISLYVVLCIVVIALNTEKFIQKNIYIGFMYAIPMLVAFLLARFVYPVERLSQRESLKEAALAVFDSIEGISMEEFSYLGKGSFGVWLLILAIIVILFLALCEKCRLKHFLCIGYMTLGCVVISFAVIFFNNSDVSPRVIYSYGSLFGMILVYVLGQSQNDISRGRASNAIKIFSYLLIASLLLTEYTVFQKCFIERYRCNQADLYLCNIIGEKIKEYEHETGNTIDTLCYYSDMARCWQDSGYEKTTTSVRAQATGWSRTYSLNYYLGTQYKEGEPDPKLLDYFKGINWDTYSDEQLIFDGNILHICIY
ncbi:glucosyltransferase domain-containing protein [Butyrivibrio sp. AE3004]|uniref:glucosyltransferase domain-containing protein n=1 Tax=Butyrivibrio sp. AE3004 TaxID=1506994 RepID=UPI000494765D|nr:glucosyltransferase domain-containing protein [Butyrivibrio sp. AE3004]